MATPYFQILYSGPEGKADVVQDVTSRVGERKISMSITDGVGMDADTCSFTIDDEGGVVEVPGEGARLRVLGGYRDGAFRDFGIFVVDEVVYDGYPQTITVNMQSADAKSALKEPRSQSYKPEKYPTYGDLFDELSSRNKLTAAIPPELKSKALKFEAQQEEGDSEFLTRVAGRMGYSITVKEERIVAAKRGAGKSVSGKDLPPILVAWGKNLLDYSVSRKDRMKYTDVAATYFDRDGVETKEITSKSSNEGPRYKIREVFKDEEEAEEAAKSKAENLRRGTATASFTIDGDPYAMAEAFAVAVGIRRKVDGSWRTTTVNHDWTSEGAYTTKLACELPDSGGEADGS